ncbi:MAG: L,D-transpeptidase family protein [Acidimicrobiia bacterium]
MPDRINRRSISLVTACLTAVAVAVVTVGLAPSASAHHGSPIGKTGGTASAPAPAPRPATPAPAPANPAAPTQSQPSKVSGTLDIGSSGDGVRAVEERLSSLKYWLPNVDDTYDDDTYQAVMAFQKVHRLDRTGVVTPSVWSAMEKASDPAPSVSNGAGNRVEVDLGRQVLFLYEGGGLSKIFAMSSGTADTPTPTGDYRIYSRSTGWETSRLGRLYNSQYFVGGYAIHGSLSVPNYPASHGCVRLTMSAAEWFPQHVGIGTPVHVR